MAKEFGYVDAQKIKIDMLASKLDSKAKTLIGDLTQVRHKIANGQLDRLNTLGEVQGAGSDIDNMCGQIRALLSSLEDYDTYCKKVSE